LLGTIDRWNNMWRMLEAFLDPTSLFPLELGGCNAFGPTGHSFAYPRPTALESHVILDHSANRSGLASGTKVEAMNETPATKKIDGRVVGPNTVTSGCGVQKRLKANPKL